MIEIACCLFLPAVKPMLLKLLTPPSKYLVDLLNIDNPYFEQIVGQIYPTELGTVGRASASMTALT